MKIFDNYPMPVDEVPNNIPKYVIDFHADVAIIIGSTATHRFEIPKEYLENCTNIEVIYNQGLKWILTKTISPVSIIVEDDVNVLYCYLSPAETNEFNYSEKHLVSELAENNIINELLDTTVQVKFINESTGKIISSDIYKVKVKNSLLETASLI